MNNEMSNDINNEDNKEPEVLKRQVVVFLDEAEHSLFKQYAISQNMPMGHIIRDLIEPLIEKQKEKGDSDNAELQ